MLRLQGLLLSSGGDGACGSSQGGECAGGGPPGVWLSEGHGEHPVWEK